VRVEEYGRKAAGEQRSRGEGEQGGRGDRKEQFKIGTAKAVITNLGGFV
jgi:hypothetical protein